MVWLETDDDHIALLDEAAFVMVLQLEAAQWLRSRSMLVMLNVVLLVEVVALAKFKSEHLHLPAIDSLFLYFFRESEWFGGRVRIGLASEDAKDGEFQGRNVGGRIGDTVRNAKCWQRRMRFEDDERGRSTACQSRVRVRVC